MLKIAPYLTFNGNCREAMEFYHGCLGGTLHLQLLEDEDSLAATLGKIVIQASLKSGGFELLASDLVAEEGLADGNKIAIQCAGNRFDEVAGAFEKLAKGGIITQRYRCDFPYGLATLTDKYGIDWVFSFAGLD